MLLCVIFLMLGAVTANEEYDPETKGRMPEKLDAKLDKLLMLMVEFKVSMEKMRGTCGSQGASMFSNMMRGKMPPGATRVTRKMTMMGSDGKQLSEDDPMYKMMLKRFGGMRPMGSMMGSTSLKMTGPDGKPMEKDDPTYKKMMQHFHTSGMKPMGNMMRSSRNVNMGLTSSKQGSRKMYGRSSHGNMGASMFRLR